MSPDQETEKWLFYCDTINIDFSDPEIRFKGILSFLKKMKNFNKNFIFFCLNDKEVRTTLNFVNDFKCDKMFVRYPGTPDMIVHMIDADVFTDEFGRVIY